MDGDVYDMFNVEREVDDTVTREIEKLFDCSPNRKVRIFESGATRDDDATKLDYEGFFSPLTLKRFGEYMNTHRVQSDGTVRASDNWQKGMPEDAFMKSLWRHMMDAWTIHRGYLVYHEVTTQGEVTHYVLNNGIDSNPGWKRVTLEDALCGVMFNSMGYLHEYMKKGY